MKINMPVTNNEVTLDDSKTIVSKTDLKGAITYVNPYFIEISGFSEVECIGKNQNIVRHPDMPPVAFQDLWETIKSGNPWIGTVKNRCKNGDFYWVEANVTPIFQNGSIVEYMSIRTKPSRQQIADAEKLYQNINSGHAELKATGVSKILEKITNTTLMKKFLTLMILMVSILAGIGTYVVNDFNLIQSQWDYYQSHAEKRQHLLIEMRSHFGYVGVIHHFKNYILRDGDKKYLDRFEQSYSALQKNLDNYLKLDDILEKERNDIDDIKAIANQYQQAISIAKTMFSNRVSIQEIDKKIKINDSVAINALENLQRNYEQAATTIKQSITKEIKDAKLNMIMMGCIAMLFVFASLYWALNRGILSRLEGTIRSLRSIMEGNFKEWIDISRNDEIGDVTRALKSMQIKIGFDIDEATQRLHEGYRIQTALDNVSTNVMIANEKRDIIYMNTSVMGMFKIAQSDIQKDLAHFHVDKLMGASIDSFHKNPAHQKQLLEKLQSTYSTTIKIGGRTFDLVANSVKNETGESLGSVVEWNDRTEDVAIEEEVEMIVRSAANGDFNQRIEMANKQGFYQTISQLINHLVDAVDDPIKECVRVTTSLSKGDLTNKMEGEYSGEFARLQEAMDSSMGKLLEMVVDIRTSAIHFNTATSEIAQGNTNLSQRTEEQASSLEETAATMEEMTSTVKQNADNATMANELSVDTRHLAEKGGSVVGDAIKAMSGINESSRKIADIIGVIDDIAFQTNLLALNAAVEAARAGDQGRGFAVVAAEVRALAQRSAEAAKEIKSLIQDSVMRVDEGSIMVNQSGETLKEIIGAVKKVSDIIGEIAAASLEQSNGIDEVNKVVMQLDEVTQQNAAVVEQAASASEAMEDQANELSNMMEFFNTGEN